MQLIGGVVAGILGGLGWGIVGAIKNYSNDKSEEFEIKKFTKTVLLGAIVGAYIGYTGDTFSDNLAESVLPGIMSMTPLMAVVDKVVGIIYNGIKKLKAKTKK